jgi:hypothetical protein
VINLRRYCSPETLHHTLRALHLQVNLQEMLLHYRQVQQVQKRQQLVLQQGAACHVQQMECWQQLCGWQQRLLCLRLQRRQSAWLLLTF